MYFIKVAIITAFSGFLTVNENTVDLGISLNTEPASDVTVEVICNNPRVYISNRSLTFNSDNYNDQQFVTIQYNTDKNNTLSEENISVTFKYTGGKNGSRSLSFKGINPIKNPLSPLRPAFSEVFYTYDIYQDIHVYSNAQINAARQTLIDAIWKNNDYSDTELGVDQVTENFTGVSEFTSLPSFSSMRRVRVDMDDGEFYDYAYIIEPVSITKNNLVWVNYGHGSAFDINETDDVIEEFLSRGYIVCTKHLSLNGLNNTTRNPPITTVGVVGHNLLPLIETATLNPVKYFIESQIRVTNYALSIYPQLNQNNYYMMGVSGGGWSTAITAAIDTRIKKSFSVAGIQPLWANPLTNPSTSDWEQGYEGFPESDWHIFLANTISYMDVFILAAQNREHYHFRNITDPCCFSGHDALGWGPKLQALVKHFANGKFDFFLYSAPNHQYELSEQIPTVFELIEN